MTRAKCKDMNKDGQQSLFDELVVPTVTEQADELNIDKSRSKPLRYPKPIQAAHDNGAGTIIPKGRKPVFVVEDAIRLKYPFIRHQPAVLMDYRNIVDIVVRDGKKEYWFGVDRHKNEILPGSFEKKIPDHLKESVMEYIENLKVI